MISFCQLLIKSFMHHISDLPKTEELYPMLSSTAAKSKMSLTCAQSYPCNLAFECVKILNDISTTNIKGIDFLKFSSYYIRGSNHRISCFYFI